MKVFPIISGWNFIGKLIGIGIAAVSPAVFTRFAINAEEILLLNVFVYLLAFMVIQDGQPHGLKRGLKKVELSWILEDNKGMRDIIESIGGVAYKRYRIYSKDLN